MSTTQENRTTPNVLIDEDWLAAQIRAQGFDLAHVAPPRPAATIGAFRAWLEGGHHGAMAYLARPDSVHKRADPRHIKPSCRTVLTVAMNYYTHPLPDELRDDPARGLMSRYAWADNYYHVLAPRLRALAEALEARLERPVVARAYAGDGPILEKALAAEGGLGFVGKNTLLIHPELGSWLFLGELLLDVELPPLALPPNPGAAKARAAGCGTCTRCLEVCPTGALTAPYFLDAQRCISYLTIELKGSIPRDLRPLIGHRVFGCDLCQDVCPWNQRFARPTSDAAFQPREDAAAPLLLDLMALDDKDFRLRYRGNPILRAKRHGLLRNVTVALGNWGDPAAIPALAQALADPHPLIREHAAWALGRVGGGRARQALGAARTVETDPQVQAEIGLSLAEG